MLGQVPSRNFYVPVQISDSLKLLWEKSAYGGFPNASVSVYDEMVFINDLSGRVFAYNISTGKEAGMLRYKGAIYSSPALFKSAIVFPVTLEKENTTEIVFYDYQEGKEISVKEIEGKILNQMISSSESIILLTHEGTVYKFDNRGNEVWKTETKVRTNCSPSSSKGLIVFGNIEGEIIALDNSNGKINYRVKSEGIFSGAPSIDNDIFYLSNENGNVYARQLKDGSSVWEFNTNSRILMTPAYDDENLYVGNLSGELFSLNKYSGSLNWKIATGGVLNATPLITENRIIIPDVFFAYYLVKKSDGKIMKKIKLEGRAKLTPVYFRNVLYIGFDDGILRAYEFVQ